MITLSPFTANNIKKITNKKISYIEMSIVNNHVNLILTFENNIIIRAISFYEEDNNILFNIIEPEYSNLVIKYTNDVGVLNHSFINSYINTRPNFFTKVYVFEEVFIDNFKLPIEPIYDDDGNMLTLEERFNDAYDYVGNKHYIEFIERVDGDLLHYPHKVTIDNLKVWFEQLWNMYSYLHNFNLTYDDIKPNNIGYIIQDDQVFIKMIDLESIRKINDDYTINLINSGMYKTSKYYTFYNYLYDSVDILSMIFALFNAYCRHDFRFCNKTLSELLGCDCSNVEQHFFNFKDITYCSNYKFVFIVYTLMWMTLYFENNTNFSFDEFYNYLVSNIKHEELSYIFANIALYIYMNCNDMLTFRNQIYGEGKNPINLQKLYNKMNYSNSSNISSESTYTDFDSIINFIKKDVISVFDNYKNFIIKSYDAGTFKYLAKMLYK